MPPGSGKYVFSLADTNFTTYATADLIGESPLLIEFYTQWCGHCKQLAPMWRTLATQLRGRVRVAAMDISENPLTMEQLSVTAFPTIMYIIKNRVYTYPGSKARSLVGLKRFALGGFNEHDWTTLGRPPKPTTAGYNVMFRIKRMFRVTLFFWTRATLPSVLTFVVGCMVGGVCTFVAMKAAGNQHLAELEDELIDRLNDLEERENGGRGSGGSGGSGGSVAMKKEQ